MSPDGSRVVTTINDPGAGQPDYQRRKNPLDLMQNYFVANFKDYRFLQVLLSDARVWRGTTRRQAGCSRCPAPTTPSSYTRMRWSPDGKYGVRARPRDAYPAGGRMAERERPERDADYDLYRIPFRDGQGGKPEPIARGVGERHEQQLPQDLSGWTLDRLRTGAQWPVDAPRQPPLHRAPAAAAAAREMRCNTPLMNSWHTFSPNGRWLVFLPRAAHRTRRCF